MLPNCVTHLKYSHIEYTSTEDKKSEKLNLNKGKHTTRANNFKVSNVVQIINAISLTKRTKILTTSIRECQIFNVLLSP